MTPTPEQIATCPKCGAPRTDPCSPLGEHFACDTWINQRNQQMIQADGCLIRELTERLAAVRAECEKYLTVPHGVARRILSIIDAG